MVPFQRAFDPATQISTYGRRYDALALVTSSQAGKSDAVIDIIGWTLDQRPAPVLYVGPNKEFLKDEIEPRLSEMLTGTPRLAEKLAQGKRNTKFRKMFGGVPIALGWAGSSTSFRAMAAKVALIDELDAMANSIQGNGDPFSLLEARGFSFRDRIRAAISTPLTGTIDVYTDEVSGLELWRQMEPEDVQSPIWRLWQSGTMHHFCWPCPECATFFVPRFKQLRWPEGATPAEAKRKAYLECPHCGGIINEHHKPDMNARGVYVAPGQSIAADGTLTGDPPETTTLSMWASGLCSPMVTFGERAASYLTAKQTGEEAKIQGVMNTGFGECYAPGGGDVPEWEEVAALRRPYKLFADGQPYEMPSGIRMLTMTVDVQKNRLVYVIRGWGQAATSWLVDCGELYGQTTEAKVWNDLGLLLKRPISDMVIKRCFVDSGFRPGKPGNLPVNRVYEFCRRFRGLAYATKGSSVPLLMPLKMSKIEVTATGTTKKHGLELVLLETDWCKSWVHERLRWDSDLAGAWYLPEDVSDGYCKQIVSEARVRKPNGQATWARRSRDNHFLDCEAMHAGLQHSLNLKLYSEREGEAVVMPALKTVALPKAAPPVQAKTAPYAPVKAALPPPAKTAKPTASAAAPAATAVNSREARKARIAALTSLMYGS